MTISEEKKERITELYEKGLSKKEISRTVQVSYPSIKSILDENDIKQNQEVINERNEVLINKLSDIFNYENCTEEAVLELIFNLKKIANDSGIDLGEFIEDIEFIFDKINKYIENPIKLFNFIVDISSNLSLAFDSIEPEPFLEIVDLYYDKGLQIREADEYIAEIEIKAERLLENVKPEYNKYQNKINCSRQELNQLTSNNSLMTAKLLQQPNKEKLQKAMNRNNELQSFANIITIKAQVLDKKNQELEIENQELIKKSQITDKELGKLTKIIDRVWLVFPDEIANLIKDV